MSASIRFVLYRSLRRVAGPALAYRIATSITRRA